ncbi:glycosyltransferase family 4 protein [Bacillus sp. KH172YL63]|uniref:glycosyltransferase family 4 protein n=1 Tax=Bacillus sp. KH172YL63 TaxID=2709784 RepID=UPI0013E4EF82|nr:glycosyltransferase [Bacillus sp. KH172YL63]BCB05868.1 hypothetical protein KH172YL63_40010 [Bacillus sp. KH172YL63]
MKKIKFYTENDINKQNKVGSTKYIQQILSFYKSQTINDVELCIINKPKINKVNKIKAFILLLTKNIPVQNTYREKFSELDTHSTNEFSIIESIYLAPFIKKGDNSVLLAQDSIARLQQSIAMNSSNWLKRIYYSISSIAYLKLETQIYKKFKKVIFVSELDKQFIESMVTYRNFSVLEIGLDEDDLYINNDIKLMGEIRKTYGDYILFTGNMEYPPNHEASLRLINDIFPYIKNKKPKLKLLLAGVGSEKYNAPDHNIFGIGKVDSLKEYIHCSTIYVSPLVSGSGMKNKILEALAQNSIVIASDKSVEGIKTIINKEHLIISNENGEFIESILSVLEEKNKYSNIREQGYKYILNHHMFDSKNNTLLHSLFE